MTARIIVGDCREVLAGMEADSIDACCTDPPYGLEFMGKEWDKLDHGLPQENVWKGRRGKGGSHVGDDDTKPSSRHHVSYGNSTRSQFKRCTICGKRQFSGSPCKCDEPQWVIEHPDGAPSSAIRMQRWHETWAREVYRVLKPGAHLLAFSGTRTSHRMVCAIEDAGFEIRDCLMWLYGSGFPKSLDVSKALDKVVGAEREVVGQTKTPFKIDKAIQRRGSMNAANDGSLSGRHDEDGYYYTEHTTPATDLARQWDGWGTALKPAYEPIILARKPLRGTVAANVTAYGTGGLNIDATRIGTDGGHVFAGQRHGANNETVNAYGDGLNGKRTEQVDGLGRWPANVLLSHHPDCVEVGTKRVKGGGGNTKTRPTKNTGYDGGWLPDDGMIGYADADGMETVSAWDCHPDCPVALLDAQSGERPSRAGSTKPTAESSWFLGAAQDGVSYGNDTGGASRFMYTSKASTAERWGLLSCDCDKESDEWDEPGQSQSGQTDITSLPRATSEAASMDAYDSLTLWNGNDTTDPSRSATKSTIETTTNKTTISETSNSSPQPSISASTAVVSTATDNGGSPAVPVANSSHSPKNTSTSPRKAGRSMGVAAPVTSLRSAKTNVCERCGKPLSLTSHPTQKPVDLMQWLVRLVTPKGGTVLDPFTGSGSTGIAADREGMDFIGIEQDESYAAIARRRIVGDCPLFAMVAD